MKYHPTLIPSLACALVAAALVLVAAPAKGAVIYSENFITAANAPISNFGWTAYRNNGTNLSASTVDPLYVLNLDYVFIGSGPAAVGGSYAMISGAPAINPALYENDLTISFVQNATDASTSSVGQMGWRVLAEVGGLWYTSDLLSFSSAEETRSAIVADPIWRSWESDLTDGFDITGISGTAANLPAGTITSLGILAIDGNQNNDRMRLFSFEVSGTLIPEPSRAVLLGLGCLTLLLRRRRA